MSRWKLILFALAIAVSTSVLTTASRANNYQDLWWNPNESGWGINISQQGDVMFATWFIYGAGNQPTWIYLSRADRSGATGNTFSGGRHAIFRGALCAPARWRRHESWHRDAGLFGCAYRYTRLQH